LLGRLGTEGAVTKGRRGGGVDGLDGGNETDLLGERALKSWGIYDIATFVSEGHR